MQIYLYIVVSNFAYIHFFFAIFCWVPAIWELIQSSYREGVFRQYKNIAIKNPNEQTDAFSNAKRV